MSPSDSEKFVEIKEAYDTLRSAEKRRAYDDFLAYGYGAQQQQSAPGSRTRSSNFDPPSSDFKRQSQFRWEWTTRRANTPPPPYSDPSEFQRVRVRFWLAFYVLALLLCRYGGNINNKCAQTVRDNSKRSCSARVSSIMMTLSSAEATDGNLLPSSTKNST